MPGALALLALALSARAEDPPLVPPRVLACPPAAYPKGLAAGDRHVVVELLVDEAGRVSEATLLSGDAPFGPLALDASRACAFSPAIEEGEPVPVWVPMTWSFVEPPARVQGAVRTSGSGRPAAGLTLRVGDRLVTTDEAGAFSLEDAPKGELTVALADPGYRMAETTIAVAPDEEVALELWVTPELWATEALGLYVRERPATIRHALGREQVAAMPGSLGDPVRAAQNLPGLVRTPFDAGWLLVRGGDNDDTGMFLDGVGTPMIFHLGGYTSILHPEITERVELWPGVPPARYGRSIAGAANLHPRPLVGEPAKAVAGLNLAWGQGYFQAPLGDGAAIAVAARRSFLDAVLAVAVGEGGAAIAPRFSDAELRFESERFGLLVSGLSDAAEAPTGRGDETVTIRQRAAQAQARITVPVGGGDLDLRPWIASQGLDVRSAYRTQLIDELHPGLRVEWTRDAAVDWTIGAEGEWRRYALTWNEQTRGAPATLVDPYVEAAFGEEVRAQLGLRGESVFVNGQLPRFGLSPRLHLRWQATPALALVGEAGRLHQPPPWIVVHGMSEGRYLPLDTADAVSAGVRLAKGPVGVDLDVWRRASRFSGFEADGSVGPLQGRAFGLESAARARIGHGEGTVLLQWSRGLAREAPGDLWLPYRYDEPVRITGLWLQELPRGWALSGRWRFATGVPAAADVDEAYDILLAEMRDVVASDGRLPPFHALDLKVSRRFTFRNWQLDAYLDVENAYSRRVPEPAINGIDDTLVVYGFGMPVLPILGFDGTFWPTSSRQRRERATSSR